MSKLLLLSGCNYCHSGCSYTVALTTYYTYRVLSCCLVIRVLFGNGHSFHWKCYLIERHKYTGIMLYWLHQLCCQETILEKLIYTFNFYKYSTLVLRPLYIHTKDHLCRQALPQGTGRFSFCTCVLALFK